MRGLVPRIPLMEALCPPDRDGRDEPGHDGLGARIKLIGIRAGFKNVFRRRGSYFERVAAPGRPYHDGLR